MRLKRIAVGAAAAAAFIAAVPAVLFALSAVLPSPLPAVTNYSVSPALYDVKGRLFHVRLSGDSEWSLPVPLSEMGKWLPVAAVGVEDRRFRSHSGVDFLALARAVLQNAASMRVVSGASTISSQVIRLSVSNAERRQRDILTKVTEFALAMKLERAMSKDGILETYLNRAPFGGNIRGVQAAAMIYFGKPAARLSPGEACLLIGMLKSPSRYRPDRHPEAAGRRRDFIIRLLEERGVFTRAEAEGALLEELPSRWLPPPMRAFHFAEAVLENQDGGLSAGRIDTTLDLEAQTRLEAIMRGAAASFPDTVTAAAGVVDNKTGALTAWVGNARFASIEHAPAALSKEYRGVWVDCGRAPRSPGSALKPFAYLAAFDRGLLTPGGLLADSPLAFSGRAPRNFDLTYRGAVSARVALSDSLNAPAVRVLRMAGPENVLGILRGFGFDGLNEPASHYGDSLILGGCEVSVMQMLAAYSALANGGVHRPLALLKKDAEDPLRSETRLASEAAAWMVCDILDNKSRLAAFAGETLGSNALGGNALGDNVLGGNALWRVALKTGTSYGLRDAWTAAWTPDFTVVVWVGDPGGDPWPGLVGAQAAAPAAVSALRFLSPSPRWYVPPEGIALREVCSLSGRPPSAACLSTRRDWYIEGVSRSVPCDLHAVKDGKSALLWPAELALAGTPRSEIQKRHYVSITSPIAGATYYLAPLATEQKIPLRAEGAAGRVWWYMDGEYIGTSAGNESFFHNFRGAEGPHSISAADEEGRTAVTHITLASPGKGREDSAPKLD